MKNSALFVSVAVFVALAPVRPVAAQPAPMAAGGSEPAHGSVDYAAAFTAWAAEPVRAAAGARADRGLVPVALGKPYAVQLLPAAAVKPAAAVSPDRLPDAPHAGLFRLRVAQRGTYGVALSTPGWVDVVRGGRLVKESGHGNADGIRKIVLFPLRPGDHVIQIVANPGSEARLMVVRVGQ